MSSIAPKSLNPETEMTHVMVEIPGNDQPVNDKHRLVASEWENCMIGKETTIGYRRERKMEKVPSSLLKSEKGRRNRECYKPAVVSLGPYHHSQPGLEEAEKYKRITLEECCLRIGKSTGFLYNKVFEVVHDARKCYIDGSTDAYNNEELSQMMLRDGCFILFFIECISRDDEKLNLTNEYLGTIEFLNIMSDLFLLENQIPFVVLQVLLELRFPRDKGENVLNVFFNFLNCGTFVTRIDKKVLEYNKQRPPLHLLELYRSYFILFSAPDEHDPIYSDKDYNYVRENRWFSSATQLKAKWIFLDESRDDADGDMKFELHSWHGEFKIAHRAVSSYTKAIYMNMIAYEMCPHNPNDFRISSYIKVMKALIMQESDVKELRDKNILLHGLGRDEEVVKMFDEIEVPPVNLFMFNHLRRKIAKLHMTDFKAWLEELSLNYFSSPWKVLGVLVAAALLITSFVQTYYDIKPHGGR